MATFPIIGDSIGDTVTVDTASYDVPMPPGVVAGDGLLVVFSARSGLSDWGGFTEVLNHVAGLARMLVGYRHATGTEGASLPVVFDSANTFSVAVLRYRAGTIEPWGITPPEAVSETSASPPTLSPSWGIDLNGWLTCLVVAADSDVVTGRPDSYVNVEYLFASPDAQVVDVSSRDLETGTESPTNYLVDGFSTRVAATVAIKPGTGEALGYTGFGAVNI